jgi:hypothetical protein
LYGTSWTAIEISPVYKTFASALISSSHEFAQPTLKMPIINNLLTTITIIAVKEILPQKFPQLLLLPMRLDLVLLVPLRLAKVDLVQPLIAQVMPASLLQLAALGSTLWFPVPPLRHLTLIPCLLTRYVQHLFVILIILLLLMLSLTLALPLILFLVNLISLIIVHLQDL